MTRYETVSASDGDTFEAYCAIPDGDGPWPGIVLFQEIFGINDNMRGLAEKVAEAGYVALVPDMFWRIERRFERKDESGLEDGIAMIQKFDWERGGADIGSTLAHLRAMPECNGRAGGVGFCFGGVLAYLLAATAQPDAAVSYYGSGVHGMLNLADKIECPIMFHYGNQDAFIPGEQIDQVEAAVAGRPNVEFHRYDAGHAFSNWDAPSMYNQAAADEAWARTLDFFARHLRP
ncbi:MAG TPA: dienelactone hydrolase family protein [Acidimicrobiia bacterium]|nr:dienelactone hydrolase family protein [Acidimicrobiia bacterium]